MNRTASNGASDRRPPRRTLVVANQKGGVGKTTTTLNLGAALAERGERVLLVDLDPQAGLTAAFGINPYGLPATVDSVLEPGAGPEDLLELVQDVGDGLHLVPSSLRLHEAEWDLARQGGGHRLLARLLGSDDGGSCNGAPGAEEGDLGSQPRYREPRYREPRDREPRDDVPRDDELPYDYVLLDTPPSLGPLTRGALAAAGELLVPVHPEYLSVRGIRGLLMAVWEIHEGTNPDLDLLGVVATRVRDVSSCREVLDELRSVFQRRFLETVIEDDEAVASAPISHRPLVHLFPDHPVAHAYRRLAREVQDARP